MTVERLVVEAVAADRLGRHAARLVAAGGGILDLDDLGAEVAEHLHAVRSGAELGEREDAQTVEGKRGSHQKVSCLMVQWDRPPCRSAVRRTAGCGGRLWTTLLHPARAARA